MTYLGNLLVSFLVAFGMVVGGSLLGGIGAILTHQAPMALMKQLSDQLKIWAMVSALGGSMDMLRAIGDGFLTRNLNSVGRQLTFVIVAFLGCQAGNLLIQWLSPTETGGLQ